MKDNFVSKIFIEDFGGFGGNGGFANSSAGLTAYESPMKVIKKKNILKKKKVEVKK